MTESGLIRQLKIRQRIIHEKIEILNEELRFVNGLLDLHDQGISNKTTLEEMILKFLATEDLRGHEIRSRLENLGMRYTNGSVRQTLHDLKKRSLISLENRVYSLNIQDDASDNEKPINNNILEGSTNSPDKNLD